MQCSCGCTEIDINDAGGEAICTNCGTVLEENTIVNSIEFAESSSGSSSVVGQFVSATCTKPYGSGGGPGHGFSKESREVGHVNSGCDCASSQLAALPMLPGYPQQWPPPDRAAGCFAAPRTGLLAHRLHHRSDPPSPPCAALH
jgi:hypothetical protein